jgi:MFS family permease
MQSARSGLSMIGTVLAGRMSDRFGRYVVLFIGFISSLFSYIMNYNATTITAIWIAMIPSALLNQNYNILKALFADYSTEYGYTEAERASAIGQLGMAVGFSFMVGPMVGAYFLTDFHQANIAAIIITLFSGLCMFYLPKLNILPSVNKDDGIIDNDYKSSTSLLNLVYDDNNNVKQNKLFNKDEKDNNNNIVIIFKKLNKLYNKYIKHNKITTFFYLPVAQKKGVKLLLFMRFSMALAFNIFMTIWTVSLKKRFLSFLFFFYYLFIFFIW